LIDDDERGRVVGRDAPLREIRAPLRNGFGICRLREISLEIGLRLLQRRLEWPMIE
jgi:hypothetical protein